MVQIVCITEGVPLRAQLLCLAQARRARCAYAAVGLVQGYKPLVARSNGVTQGGRAVRGAIIYQNAPESVKSLRRNRVRAGGQEGLRVVHRHNDSNLTGLHFVTSA